MIFIVNFDEKQTLSWSCCSRLAPVFGCKDFGDLFDGDLAPRDIEKGPDNVAHHLVKKPIPFKFENNFLFSFNDI